jgi:hypothetical protein
MRDAPAGASAACCRSRPRPFPCHSGPAYIVSNRLSASPGAIENQTQSHWKDLRRRLPRRQLCGGMIHLVPGHERQSAIRRNSPLWLVAEGLLSKACRGSYRQNKKMVSHTTWRNHVNRIHVD